MNKERPNILIITSDQQRKDSMGCYNSKLSTPCLDALADDGIVFDRSYICHPTCTPSRASILTGQLASKHGAYTIGTGLSEDVPMFSEVLDDGGYETYFVGKPHFQQLSTPGTLEYSGKANDEQFFQEFDGSYYGFEHVKIYNGHTKYPCTAGMHYRLWLKEKGLDNAEIENLFNHHSTGSFREHGVWDIKRELHPSVFTSESAIDFLEQRDAEKPFAMWVSFSDPHDPHVVPEPYASMYRPEEVDYLGYREGEHDCRPDCYNQLYNNDVCGLPFNDGIGVPSAPSAKFFGDDQYFREITAVHHGMVKLMDEEIGRIIEKLKEMGLYDNTLILFTTDHGDYLGNHGYVYKGFPAFEEVYNVPFIVKNVGQLNAGSRSDALISHTDIAPTVIEAADLDIPKEMDGISQWKLFTGESGESRQNVIIENRPVQHSFYQKMIVTEKYKLVVYMQSMQGELYDLTNDKNQYCNLWEEEDYQHIKQQLLNTIYLYYCREKEETEQKQSSSWSVPELIEHIWEQMHEEEPVQKRTSYS